MESTVNSIVSNAPAIWQSIAPFLAGGAGVAVALQLIKNVLGIAEAKKLVTFLNGFLSFVVVIVNAIISNGNANPLLFGQKTAAIMGFALIIHRFVVSPVYGTITKQLGGLVSDANSYRASQAPASQISPQVSANPLTNTTPTLPRPLPVVTDPSSTFQP